MILRCVVDGLLLEAQVAPLTGQVTVWDGDEAFVLEAVEAIYYEVVRACADELLAVECAGFRLLKRADDFDRAARC